MPRRKKHIKKQASFWSYLVAVAVLTVLQQTGKPISQDLPDEKNLNNVSVVSVYDGDTFKINLNCSWAVYCEKMPVRVRGVDCPEMRGKNKKEKFLAKKAKAFTKAFLRQTPISLSECGRDKYFRLLCKVTNASGQNLAQELIQHNLGRPYDEH